MSNMQVQTRTSGPAMDQDLRDTSWMYDLLLAPCRLPNSQLVAPCSSHLANERTTCSAQVPARCFRIPRPGTQGLRRSACKYTPPLTAPDARVVSDRLVVSFRERRLRRLSSELTVASTARTRRSSSAWNRGVGPRSLSPRCGRPRAPDTLAGWTAPGGCTSSAAWARRRKQGRGNAVSIRTCGDTIRTHRSRKHQRTTHQPRAQPAAHLLRHPLDVNKLGLAVWLLANCPLSDTPSVSLRRRNLPQAGVAEWELLSTGPPFDPVPDLSPDGSIVLPGLLPPYGGVQKICMAASLAQRPWGINPPRDIAATSGSPAETYLDYNMAPSPRVHASGWSDLSTGTMWLFGGEYFGLVSPRTYLIRRFISDRLLCVAGTCV